MILRRHAGCRDNSFLASPRGERVSLCCPAVSCASVSVQPDRALRLPRRRALGGGRTQFLPRVMNCSFGIPKVEVGKERRRRPHPRYGSQDDRT